ncbi:MAG: hypothetical protein KGI67_00620 [Pseudomonadota bacterium]|nr:hypothetical protein [Pseudomonadota bacterium]
MNARPAPHTPYELKLRLAEEQRFYETHGEPFGGRVHGLGSLANTLADGLDAVSHALRAVGNGGGHHHAA